ncbi:MAG: argininosuccinate lyase [Clostridiales bacterium]|jgi:argininosuccinate lyase|nr:argininosuccinate lyase [Clostridiales bacterium]
MKNKKLWGGRFTKETNEAANSFHSSISFDKRLYKQDIEGSKAHAEMLGKQGIISNDDANLIISTLEIIKSEIESGDVLLDEDAEDIHMNIEKLLIGKIGETGKRLHTARSRNDQVALDMRLYVVQQSDEIVSLLKKLMRVLISIATEHVETVMPGYTHMQKAQPITLAHHMLAYFEMFRRDCERLGDCRKRANISPLGSGALAGAPYPLDRKFVAAKLGFDDITRNSLDGVSDRDFCAEFIFCLSLIMTHLSRFCEEIILWATNEFGFIELDDSYSTGSSIMPQKKNPDMAELIRGKSGRVYGSLITILTVMKGLPLAYNKDMQEDKEAVFDAVDTVCACLSVFEGMISTTVFHKHVLEKGAEGGFTTATDAADWLVRKGVPFRDAHEIVGWLVLRAAKDHKTLSELTIEDYQTVSDIFDETIYEVVSPQASVEAKNVPGGTSGQSVRAAILEAAGFLLEN